MTTKLEYIIDQELPAIPLNWQDGDGATIDFSSGWTFTIKLATVAAPTTAILSKTSGITLDSTSPNVTIEFTASDLSTVSTALGTIPAAGTPVKVYVYARRDSDSKDDVFPTDIIIRFFTAPA